MKIEGLTSDSSAVEQEEYEDLKYTDSNGIFTARDIEAAGCDKKEVEGFRRKNQPKAERTGVVILNTVTVINNKE